ncbi:hypothetical protein COCON_G00160800 [Conger conger]|uniref:Sesquipedalian n=1 Tax=Conger conger TaxID=82655 RepID=A0A9Q1DA36_CONCO|nr:hypothetical protein COCON_G00160800 [Conger conger]
MKYLCLSTAVCALVPQLHVTCPQCTCPLQSGPSPAELSQLIGGECMGKAGAPCSGSSGIVSFLTAVPCLSCKPQPVVERRMSDQGKGSASTAAGAPAPGSDTYKGWLFKWTNYLKGYQRRWFVLSNGLLSYYRTQAEMAHTCRGTINLATAHIDTEDACNIVLSSGGRTYHLKAGSEVERQRWVTALELAKARAIRMMHDQSERGFSGNLAMSWTVVIRCPSFDIQAKPPVHHFPAEDQSRGVCRQPCPSAVPVDTRPSLGRPCSGRGPKTDRGRSQAQWAEPLASQGQGCGVEWSCDRLGFRSISRLLLSSPGRRSAVASSSSCRPSP